MADFKKLQQDGEDILPVTHEAAVLNDNNESIAVSYQTTEDDGLSTDDKSIVGAINEVSAYGIRMNDPSGVIEPGDPNNPILIRIEELKNTLVEYIINNPTGEDSNESKQLIANAIGEPLNAEDSFDEMSNDINGLLATFKTNMMNNGITVEAGDKFKSLIDKIATLADSGGKGVQFVQGTSTVVQNLITYTRVNGNTNGYYYIEIPNLTFEPLFIIAKKNAGAAICFINASLGFYYSGYNTSGKHITLHTYNDGSGVSIAHNTSGDTSIDFTNIKLPVDISTTGTWDWYAIGVGEENNIYQDHILDANNQIYKANYYDNFESRNTFAYTSYTTNFDSKNESYNGEMTIYVKATTNTSNSGLCATLDFVNYTPIDLTNVNSITIVAKKSYIQTNTQFGFLDFTSSSNGFNSEGAIFSRKVEIAMSTSKYETYSIDTSDMVGEYCICIESKFTGLTNKNTEAFVFIQQITLNTTEKPTDPLRDSLASILQEKGVEVTEEDDMASLIAKVDNKFNEMNTGSGSLDVISATELPATGKENQICVITDNPFNSVVITTNDEEQFSETDKVIFYSIEPKYGVQHKTFDATLNNIHYKYYISKVKQGGKFKESHYYKNNTWNLLSRARINVVNNGYYTNELGSFAVGTNISGISSDGSGFWLLTQYNAMGGRNAASSNNVKINFSEYSQIKLNIKVNNTTAKPILRIGACNNKSIVNNDYGNGTATGLALDSISYTELNIQNADSSNYYEYTVDISNITGEGYLYMHALSNTTTTYIYFKDIVLS